MKNLKYLIRQKIKKIFNGLILFLSKKKALSFLINSIFFWFDDGTYGYGYRAVVAIVGAIQIFVWVPALYLFIDVFGFFCGVFKFFALVLLFYSSVVIVEVIVRFFIVVVKKILGLKKDE